MMESRMTRNCHVRFGERYEETRPPQGRKVRFVPTPFSPLLANIALHGIENMLNEYAKTLDIRRKDKPSSQISWQRKVSQLTFVRYADDFVVLHHDLKVVQRCRELISEWLKQIGLELKPSKTRIAHTLDSEKSEDGIAGFDFLGYNIRQFPAGKYVSAKNGSKEIIGFNTFITPSKDALKKHQSRVKVNIFKKQEYLVCRKLRAWGRYRCGSVKKAKHKYFIRIGKRNWIFATKNGNANPLRLLFHSDFESSSVNYVKVKGESSPYDGNLIYWSTKMGRHPEMPVSKAIKLKKQKGKCNWCGLYFREGDVLEEDHIVATALGGKNLYDNLQLLHAHCHDKKTALDMIEIRNKRLSNFLTELHKTWSKVNYLWVEDIPVIFNH